MLWTRLVVVAGLLALPSPRQEPQPGIRFGHSLVYDTQHRRVVLADGYTWVRAVTSIEPPGQSELWAWDGRAWTSLPGKGPASRTMNRAVYDASRQTLVSFGGRVGRSESPSSDTWEWSAGAWRQIAVPADGPTVHFEMAYDAVRKTTVRYGGAVRVAAGELAWPRGTWTWNGAAWSSVAAEGPVGRAAAHMVFDSRRGEIVLFGGQGAAPPSGGPQPVFDDTWIWNGRAWRRASVSGPPARAFHAMTFDSRAGVVLVHGGMNADRILDDLWAWDGTRWQELSQSACTPGRRRLHAIVFDEARNRTVLYGGVGPDATGVTRGYDDTWEWNGQEWARVPRLAYGQWKIVQILWQSHPPKS